MTTDDFTEILNNWETELEKVVEKSKLKPPVELTVNQKKIIVQYLLGGVGKGFFEDCEDFWEGMSQEQVNESYPAYCDKSNKFVDDLKERILNTLGE